MSYPTWSDLNNSDSIVPPLGQGRAKAVGPAALMVSTLPDVDLIQSGSHTWRSRPIFNSRLLVPEKNPMGFSVAGPYMGAPYAVMLLESLIAKGAASVIILGWCGGLTSDLATGDLVVVEKALVDEGTSRHYMDFSRTGSSPDHPEVLSDRPLTRTLCDHLTASGHTAHTGAAIWTTDAIYRETPEKVAWFREKGACAVEMECSALFAAAAFRNVPIAALLVVSDSLAAKDGWDPGFKKKRFKTMRRAAATAAVELTGKL